MSAPGDASGPRDARSHAALEAADGPRVGLFLFAPDAGAPLDDLLARLPARVRAALCEIVLVEEHRPTGSEREAGSTPDGIRVLRTPGERGYGGARKAAFDYAIQQGHDVVLSLRADGTHPPELLAPLLDAVLHSGERVAIASRFLEPPDAGGLLGALRLAGLRLTNGLQNRLLGLDVRDYLSGLRAYPTRALAAVPFHLNRDDRDFDMEILIQLRALGMDFEEVPARSAWSEFASDARGLEGILRCSLHAILYRLHQLHLTRDGRFLVDLGVGYTLKSSALGSHMQIVAAIAPGSRVLDLGCSQGLLAKPLAEKSVELTGVDQNPPGGISPYLRRYFQRDLEQPLDLPLERDFDYVVIADVIEHLRGRQQLLRTARRFLREGGRLLVSTPNIALWFYRLSLLAGRFEYGPRGVLDRTHVHLYTRDTFRREVQRAGFRIVREGVTALPFEVVFESTGRSRLVRGIERFYHGLARLWPELFAYQIILEAEITTLDEASEALDAPG